MSRKHRGHPQSLPETPVVIPMPPVQAPAPDRAPLLQAAGDAYILLLAVRERLGQIDSAYRVIAGSEWAVIDRDLAQVKQHLEVLQT